MKRSFNERMDLAIKLVHCFGAFMLLGFILLFIGVVVVRYTGNLVFLIPAVISMFTGIIFFVVSMRVRYHEEKPE